MNYYNPYYMFMPMNVARPGLFGLLARSFRGFNLGSIINGTQRTLGLVNQAIPVIRQISPVMKNARTMFKVMNEFKKTDTPTPVSPTSKTTTNVDETSSTVQTSGPTFFA